MTSEERLAQIESRLTAIAGENAALKHEIGRLHDYNDIQRLMGKYMTCHVRSYKEGVLSQRNHYLFFANRPDSSAEIADHGVYVGYDHIKKMYEDILPGGASGVLGGGDAIRTLSMMMPFSSG